MAHGHSDLYPERGYLHKQRLHKKLYIDGKLIDTTDGNFDEGSNNGKATKIQIGGDGEGAYKNLTFGSMKIDNIRFYNRALSNQEIKAIYDYEKAQ